MKILHNIVFDEDGIAFRGSELLDDIDSTSADLLRDFFALSLVSRVLRQSTIASFFKNDFTFTIHHFDVSLLHSFIHWIEHGSGVGAGALKNDGTPRFTFTATALVGGPPHPCSLLTGLHDIVDAYIASIENGLLAWLQLFFENSAVLVPTVGRTRWKVNIGEATNAAVIAKQLDLLFIFVKWMKYSREEKYRSWVDVERIVLDLIRELEFVECNLEGVGPLELHYMWLASRGY